VLGLGLEVGLKLRLLAVGLVWWRLIVNHPTASPHKHPPGLALASLTREPNPHPTPNPHTGESALDGVVPGRHPHARGVELAPARHVEPRIFGDGLSDQQQGCDDGFSVWRCRLGTSPPVAGGLCAGCVRLPAWVRVNDMLHRILTVRSRAFQFASIRLIPPTNEPV